MGSLCGCQSQLISQNQSAFQISSPQIVPLQNLDTLEHETKKHFRDIVPLIRIQSNQLHQNNQPVLQSFKNSRRGNQDLKIQSANMINFSIEQGQRSLWKLNNQLSTLVCTFQQQNGELTKTFLEQQKSLRSSAPNEAQKIQNLSQISKQKDISHKENYAPNVASRKNQRKKDIVAYNKQQLKALNKQRSTKLLPCQNFRISTKQNRKSCESQNKERLKQLLERQNNPDENIIQSNSQVSQNSDQDRAQVQNFIQGTKFLDSCLKTERQKQKAYFFKQSSIINYRQTYQWNDQHSKGFNILLKNFQGLPQIQNSLKYIKDSQNLQYFDSLNLVLTILGAIQTYEQNHHIKLISYHENQDSLEFRIFVNGTKRMIQLPRQKQLQSNLLSLLSQFLMQGCMKNQKTESLVSYESPLSCIYYLTGWIPESIHLKQIGQIDGILERIYSNFVQGHTIIAFSRYQNRVSEQHSKHIYLVKILLQEEILQVNNGVKSFEQKTIGSGNFYIQWNQILQNYDVISVNWSPCIYEQTYSLSGQVNPECFNKTIRSEFPQYHLKIPSSKEDIEVRFFLQIHTQNIPLSEDSVSFAIQLYDYHGFMVHNSGDVIRSSASLNKSKQLHSDVFIFQSSEQKTEYVLVLVPYPKENSPKEKVLFTFTVSSFNNLSLKQLKQKQQIYQISEIAFVSPINLGYSINSPYFLNNLQFHLQVSPMWHLKITIESQEKHTYDINIIADPQNCKDIAKLNLQNLLSDNYRSCQIKGDGCCQFISKYDSYILVIAGYSSYKGKINIKIEVLSDVTINHPKLNNQLLQIGNQQSSNNLNNTKSVNSHVSNNQGLQNRQSISKQIEFSIICIKEIVFNPKIIFEKKINWSSANPGPRKRTKQNSTPAYHPYTTFEQFFRNPFIDKKIQAGVYQFNILSKTYEQLFNKTADLQTKLSLQPPTLSLAIMKMSSNQKNFKIINDDAFYVPFGIGYWSQQVVLEQGKYRFILPKIEKEKSVGLFRIRQK